MKSASLGGRNGREVGAAAAAALLMQLLYSGAACCSSRGFIGLLGFPSRKPHREGRGRVERCMQEANAVICHGAAASTAGAPAPALHRRPRGCLLVAARVRLGFPTAGCSLGCSLGVGLEGLEVRGLLSAAAAPSRQGVRAAAAVSPRSKGAARAVKVGAASMDTGHCCLQQPPPGCRPRPPSRGLLGPVNAAPLHSAAPTNPTLNPPRPTTLRTTQGSPPGGALLGLVKALLHLLHRLALQHLKVLHSQEGRRQVSGRQRQVSRRGRQGLRSKLAAAPRPQAGTSSAGQKQASSKHQQSTFTSAGGDLPRM